jgi:signal transduction histidine kinase
MKKISLTITQKTMIYTAFTTLLLGSLIIGYFLWMLPGLYARYKTDRYLQTTEEVQRRFIEGKLFSDDYQLSENFLLMSLKLPHTGETIQLSTTNATMDVVLKAPEIKELYHKLRTSFQVKDPEKEFTLNWDEQDFEPVEKLIKNLSTPIQQELIEINNVQTYPFEMLEDSENQEVYTTADDILIFAGTVEQNANSYASYVAFKEVNQDIYVTFASAMTPKLNELFPIVLQSTPMIVAVLLVMSLLIARWFSRKLAYPIELLAQQARIRDKEQAPVFHQPNKGDELEVLEKALNQMHLELQKQLKEVHRQNQELAVINHKQQLLLTNASHQLKTPIASSLLLVESMIHRLGKYQATATYLPEVKKEIQKMQQIVQQLMFLFEEHSREATKVIAVDGILQGIWQMYQEKAQQRELTIEWELMPVVIETEEALFVSVLDNLIQNAVKYTPRNQRMKIRLTSQELTIISETAKISEQLIQHIHEPFIRDTKEEEAGTGLGLYLVDKFVHLLEMTWTIENTVDGVQVTLNWRDENDNH